MPLNSLSRSMHSRRNTFRPQAESWICSLVSQFRTPLAMRVETSRIQGSRRLARQPLTRPHCWESSTFEQPGDVRRVVLQIGVERGDERAPGVAQARIQGGGLAGLSAASTGRAVPGAFCACSRSTSIVPSVLASSTMMTSHLLSDCGQCGRDLVDQPRQIVRFIVGRRHDRQVHFARPIDSDQPYVFPGIPEPDGRLHRFTGSSVSSQSTSWRAWYITYREYPE